MINTKLSRITKKCRLKYADILIFSINYKFALKISKQKLFDLNRFIQFTGIFYILWIFRSFFSTYISWKILFRGSCTVTLLMNSLPISFGYHGISWYAYIYIYWCIYINCKLRYKNFKFSDIFQTWRSVKIKNRTIHGLIQVFMYLSICIQIII